VTVVVLTYHAVEDGPAPLCIEPERFRAQVDCLLEVGAETLTISQLAACLRDGTLPARAVAITFDDGCASVARTAAPLLAERGLTATVFCVAGHLGGRNDWPTQPGGMPLLPLAGAGELVELHRAGVEIGAHGLEHAPLDAADATTAERELRDGRAILEEIVGSPVRSLAYPYGAAPGPAAASLVSELYDAACTTRPAHVRAATHPLALPRVDVHYLRRPAVFRRVVSGGLESYLRARGAVTAWRRRGWT
jgi:peptidoglycan/xylan/chitin deacetylase (PgdA/CDA1 family)